MQVRAIAKTGGIPDWNVQGCLQAKSQLAHGHACLPWPNATHAWHPSKLSGGLHKGALAKKVKKQRRSTEQMPELMQEKAEGKCSRDEGKATTIGGLNYC